MSVPKFALTAAGFLAGVVMTVAAIGSTASPVAAQPGDQAYLAAQKAQVMAATYQLDKIDLHGIEDDAKAGTVIAGALGNVRRARIALQATEWPEALKSLAMEQIEHMKQLEAAIRAEDAAKVVEPATKAHEVGHDLSAAVYTWLETGRAPAGGHGH